MSVSSNILGKLERVELRSIKYARNGTDKALLRHFPLPLQFDRAFGSLISSRPAGAFKHLSNRRSARPR